MVGKGKPAPVHVGKTPNDKALENTIKVIKDVDVHEVFRRYDGMYEMVRQIEGYEEYVQVLREQTLEKLRTFDEQRSQLIKDLMEAPRKKTKIGYKIKSLIGRITLIPYKSFADVTIEIRPNKLIGIDINVLLSKELEKAWPFLLGLWLADGAYRKSAKGVAMRTNSFGQITLFATLLEGGRIGVSGVSITENGIKMQYYMESRVIRRIYDVCRDAQSRECKLKVWQQLKDNIDDKSFYQLLFGHWYGDGSLSSNLRITRYLRFKDPALPEVISWFREKLSQYGFHIDNGDKTYFNVSGEQAYTLANKMLSSTPPKLLELMNIIPDDLGWKEIYRVATYKDGKLTIRGIGTVIFHEKSLTFTRFTRSAGKENLILEEWKKMGIPMDAIKVLRYPGKTYIKINAYESMKIICCDLEIMKEVAEAAKHSSNKFANKWDSLEKVQQRCKEFFMNGLKCDET